MEVIKSYDNNFVKRIVKLKQKKYRDEYGEFFVEGYKNVFDTCTAASELVKKVLFSETAFSKNSKTFGGFDVAVLSDTLFDKITETESAQGVMCICKIPSPVFPSSDRCILLDRVRDPGNVGTILRTAVACGYDVVVNNCADIYSPKVVRSAMSAIVKCKVGQDISALSIKNAGYEVIVADMNGDSVFTSPHGGKYCIVVGNEADGVCPEIVAVADKTLSLPQDNIESLNASVAAAVMMFALRYSSATQGVDKTR